MKNIYLLLPAFILVFGLSIKNVYGLTPSVVFINPGKTGEVFWDMVSEFMQQAGEQLSIDLSIYNAERDHIKMTKIADRVANSATPPQYMILVNEKGFASRILPKIPKKIKIILLNNGLSKEEREKYGGPREIFPNWLATVVPDHKKAGEDIMIKLIEEFYQEHQINSQSELGLIAIGGNKSTIASQLRLAGMREVIERYKNIRLYQTIYSEWRKDKAHKQIFGLIRRWPKTRFIWAANDPMALGALSAVKLRKYHPGKSVFIGGLNMSNAALEMVKAGEMTVTVGGHFMLGGWILVMIYDEYRGKDFSDLGGMITIPMNIISKTNVSNYMKAFGDQKWGKINFKKFSRIGLAVSNQYDFSLQKLLLEQN